jgi:hypothetical protein
MAISLGSLYVELKANTAQFLTGMTKAAAHTKAFTRDLQGGLARVGDLFANLGPAGQRLASVLNVVGEASIGAFKGLRSSQAMLGVLTGLTGGAAALGGGLFALAEHAAAVGAKIFEASEKTGIGAAQMSGLMAVSRETGENFDSLTTALARAGVNLQKAIIEPGTASGKILAQVLGGAKKLAAEGLRPMGDRLQDILRHIFAVNDAGARNTALSALLGRGWMENVESLKLLAAQGYGPAEAAARRFGIFFNDEQARQAKQFEIAIMELKGQLSGIGLAIGEKVLPDFQRLMASMVGMEPNLKALGLRILAIEAAVTGVGIPLAIKMWKEADQAAGQATQQMTDFLLRLQNLAAGEKAAADGGKSLTSGIKERTDALASLINRERDELAMLNAHGNKAAELGVEYAEMVGKIRAAGGSLQETLKAQGLAFEIFYQKMRNLTGAASLIFSEHAPASLQPPAELPLSAMPGLPPPPVIAQTEQKISMLTVRFKEFQQALIEQGQGLGLKAMDSFMSAIDQTESKLAQLAVRGRANFREILPELGESIAKAGLQKAVGGLASAFGVRGAGSKPDGTASNPLHVVMAGAAGAVSSAGIPQALHSAMGSLSGMFSKIFGGFMASGGDVSPGKAYMVGERHPEFFVPKVAGSVSKSFPTGGHTIIQNLNINTPMDADSFRRSQAQIMGDMQRSASRALARNG